MVKAVPLWITLLFQLTVALILGICHIVFEYGGYTGFVLTFVFLGLGFLWVLYTALHDLD